MVLSVSHKKDHSLVQVVPLDNLGLTKRENDSSVQVVVGVFQPIKYNRVSHKRETSNLIWYVIPCLYFQCEEFFFIFI